MRELDVWMNGERVGRWYQNPTGTPVLQYDDAWPDSPHARSLSLSLPMLPGNQPHRGARVEAWFANLLPDSKEILDRLAKRFKTGSTRPFDLLSAIGRDCVGAVQLLPAGTTPTDVHRIDATRIEDSEVAKHLRGVPAARSFGDAPAPSDFRLSIAGAQEKTALLRLDGSWYVPHGATPTSHILKLPLGLVGNMQYDLQDSVENEWLCMQLLGELGFPVAQTEMATFSDERGTEKALVVQRFDREPVRPLPSGEVRWILRLPQEDLCQATGRSPDEKYEADGGPGIAAIIALLAAGNNAANDVLTFAKAQLAFWLLAAIDGHAKNFSIFLLKDGYTLTPLYDVLSAWPIIGRTAGELAYEEAKLAMAVRGSKQRYRKLGRIPLRAWVRLATETGIPHAVDHFVELVEQVEPAISRLEARLPAGFPAHVWSRITEGVIRHRDRFVRELAVSGTGQPEPDEP